MAGPAGEMTTATSLSRGRDTLGVNDQVVISVTDVPGLSERPYRIEADGTITVPLAGKVRAEGLTIEDFKKELENELGVYIRSPRVSLRRLPAGADTIVVAGAFKNPGVYPFPDRRPLLDVIATVGGLQSNAGRTIKITRRLEAGRPQLPAAIEDPNSAVSVATVNVGRIMEDQSLADRILIEPHDTLFAEPPGVVFLTGEVLKPGSFELTSKDSFGVTELISLAGGLGRDAVPQKAKVLRPILNGSRRAEIPIDAKGILDGRLADFQVLPNDIVVVPRSTGRSHAIRTAMMYVVPAALSALVYVAVR